ncbi:type IV secretory system conjugative DNA transfer family protein [Variovorax sp. LG9.2]|uniref:type IV secretory system conjugative DNA transfer family protein n=1 Tax=Variovorax sp. LG9.2 TaxID=3048626 RepID=UPI002B229C62|nr:type IV secretory system conjugative DNA transfer family protein [Variovorax sp. LG9.2]MEB0059317.1 type IV secretory system conjugative DNA transfer family protein [Variovorax sp. LG9.2]
MKTRFKMTLGAVSLFVIGGLLAATTFLSGAVLFLLHKKLPQNVSFATIGQGWDEAQTPVDLKKVYLSVLVAAAVSFGVPGFLLAYALKKRPEPVHGNARFASHKDVQGEGLRAANGILLGRLGPGMTKRSLLCLPGYEFNLIAAPTRSGKGVSHIIPNLLTFDGSVVVLDIKGENYSLTSAFRKQHMKNEVVYFNPFSGSSMRWNPLSYISKDQNFRVNGLQALAKLIYPANPKEPFWPDSAANLFVGLALLVLETPGLPQTIGEIRRQSTGKGKSISEYLMEVMELRADPTKCDFPLSSACITSLQLFVKNPDATLNNIVATLVAPLAVFGNAVVDKATSGDDFFLTDVRKKRVSIYIHIPAKEVVQAAFIVNLFFSQLINENVGELPEDNPALKYQCLMIMDEFTSIGKVESIAKGVGFMAGYNMRLDIIIQDKSQLEAAYGKEDAHNILSNMGSRIVFTPNEVKDAEDYSKLIGNTTVTVNNRTRRLTGTGMGSSSSDTATEGLIARPLMLPQELLSMDKKKALIVRAGIPVIQADKIIYYTDPYFLERFRSVPMKTVRLNGAERSVPVPLEVPVAKWRAYNCTVEQSDFYALAGANPETCTEPFFPSLKKRVERTDLVEQMNAQEDLTDAQVSIMSSQLLAGLVDEFTAKFERI